MKLKNNTILITGGTSGLGLALAKELFKSNTVIVVSRREEAVKKAVAENKGLVGGFTVDVSDFESVKKLYDEVTKDYPELNFIINCAGIMRPVNFFDEDSKITNEIAINLNGTINMNKAFLPYLVKNDKEAAFINISSGLSYLASSAHPIYSATKSGVNGLTEALRAQAKFFGYKKLHIIQVAPPLVSETNLNPTMHKTGEKNPVNMKIDDFVKVVLKGIRKDKNIINPGPSKMLYFLGKFAPLRIRTRATRNTMIQEFGEK